MAEKMNKFLNLEKRFEKIMESIEKLPLKRANGIGSSQKSDVIAENLLSKEEFFKLSNRVKELERDAKIDSDQIDNLIIQLQSLLENKDD